MGNFYLFRPTTSVWPQSRASIATSRIQHCRIWTLLELLDESADDETDPARSGRDAPSSRRRNNELRRRSNGSTSQGDFDQQCSRPASIFRFNLLLTERQCRLRHPLQLPNQARGPIIRRRTIAVHQNSSKVAVTLKPNCSRVSSPREARRQVWADELVGRQRDMWMSRLRSCKEYIYFVVALRYRKNVKSQLLRRRRVSRLRSLVAGWRTFGSSLPCSFWGP